MRRRRETVGRREKVDEKGDVHLPGVGLGGSGVQ